MIRIIDIFTIYIPLLLLTYAGLVDCLYPLTCPAWVTLPGAYTPASIALGIMEANNSLTQAPNHVNVVSRDCSSYYFLNRLLRSAISFVDGGGTWAIVMEIRPGSLVFRATFCVTFPDKSTALLLRTLDVSTGMYS